jgi:hypothetical protein
MVNGHVTQQVAKYQKIFMAILFIFTVVFAALFSFRNFISLEH